MLKSDLGFWCLLVWTGFLTLVTVYEITSLSSEFEVVSQNIDATSQLRAKVAEQSKSLEIFLNRSSDQLNDVEAVVTSKIEKMTTNIRRWQKKLNGVSGGGSGAEEHQKEADEEAQSANDDETPVPKRHNPHKKHPVHQETVAPEEGDEDHPPREEDEGAEDRPQKARRRATPQPVADDEDDTAVAECTTLETFKVLHELDKGLPSRMMVESSDSATKTRGWMGSVRRQLGSIQNLLKDADTKLAYLATKLEEIQDGWPKWFQGDDGTTPIYRGLFRGDAAMHETQEAGFAAHDKFNVGG